VPIDEEPATTDGPKDPNPMMPNGQPLGLPTGQQIPFGGSGVDTKSSPFAEMKIKVKE
jgi:hypothetical protein